METIQKTDEDTNHPRCCFTILLSLSAVGPALCADGVERAVRAVIADGDVFADLLEVLRESMPNRGEDCEVKFGNLDLVDETAVATT